MERDRSFERSWKSQNYVAFARECRSYFNSISFFPDQHLKSKCQDQFDSVKNIVKTAGNKTLVECYNLCFKDYMDHYSQGLNKLGL